MGERRRAGSVGNLIVACLLPAMMLACATPRTTAPAPVPVPVSVSVPTPVPKALLQEDPFDPRYKVHCDNVSGKTVCVMTGNALRPFSPRYPLLSLGVISETDKDGRQRYFLRAVFVNERQWLNIGPGETLQMAADGESLRFSGAGSGGARHTGENDKVYEIALYETEATAIRKIAVAREVSVNLKGDFPLQKNFGSFNNLYFRQFIQHYIDKAPPAAR